MRYANVFLHSLGERARLAYTNPLQHVSLGLQNSRSSHSFSMVQCQRFAAAIRDSLSSADSPSIDGESECAPNLIYSLLIPSPKELDQKVGVGGTLFSSWRSSLAHPDSCVPRPTFSPRWTDYRTETCSGLCTPRVPSPRTRTPQKCGELGPSVIQSQTYQKCLPRRIFFKQQDTKYTTAPCCRPRLTGK